LQVSIEELISTPRGVARLYHRDTLPVRRPGNALIRKLMPEAVPGVEVDRIELPPGGRFTGIPHTPGTHEYLTCETGLLLLVISGEEYRLGPGDLVTFRGDQKHSYANPGASVAVGYSTVILAPVG
jgi:quercetin dioxygenase-like cupin family protein